MKIEALAALKPREKLLPFTYHSAPLQPDEILIKISHCGLCHSDIHLIDDDWKRSVYPLVPGHEIIGTIIEKGSAVKTLNIGDRVGQSWIRSACLSCPECLNGDTNFCLNKTTTCNKHYGGFADHIVSDSRFVFPIPEKLESAHAAPLLCAGATVYTPLKRYRPQSVAILGIGGLGHLALQFANQMGCEVSAISSSTSKEKDAYQLGAHFFYTWDRLPEENQYDLILSTIHQEIEWDPIVKLLKPKGTLCFLGRIQNTFSIDISPLISLGKSIAGSSTAHRADMQEMLRFAADKKIEPWIEILPLSQINQAIEKVKSNQIRYRAVLSIS